MREINKYTTSEALNLQLGQNGFDVVAEHDTNTQTPDSGNRIALQAISLTASSPAATYCKIKVSSNVWDSHTSADLFLIPGDILYGNFSGVINHTDSTAALIAYRG